MVGVAVLSVFMEPTTPTRDKSTTPSMQTPSLAEVFRREAPFVWRALRRLGVREADVEDVQTLERLRRSAKEP